MDYATRDVRMRDLHDEDDDEDDEELDIEKVLEKRRRHMDEEDEEDEEEEEEKEEEEEETRAGRKSKVPSILLHATNRSQPSLPQRRRKDATANPYIDLVATVDDDDDDDEDDEEAEAGLFSAALYPLRRDRRLTPSRISAVPTTRRRRRRRRPGKCSLSRKARSTTAQRGRDLKRRNGETAQGAILS